MRWGGLGWGRVGRAAVQCTAVMMMRCIWDSALCRHPVCSVHSDCVQHLVCAHVDLTGKAHAAGNLPPSRPGHLWVDAMAAGTAQELKVGRDFAGWGGG